MSQHGLITIKEKFWFSITILGIGVVVVLLPQVFKQQISNVYGVGAIYTVCAEGCDFTTISSALATPALTSGDTIQVGASYVSSGETFPLNISDEGVTVDCQNSGAVIGDGSQLRNINIPASTTIQNCSFNRISLRAVGGTETGIIISGNSFSTSTYSEILIHAPSATISNNMGFNTLDLTGASDATVTGNTIDVYVSSPNVTYKGIAATGLSNSVISSNTIRSYVSGSNSVIESGRLDTVTISNNIIDYVVGPSNQVNNFYAIYAQATTGTVISGNYIRFAPHSLDSCSAIALSDTNGHIDATVEHNTMYWSSNCHGVNLFISNGSNPDVSVSANYNLFYNASTTPVGDGIHASRQNSSNVTLSNDYNGFYNLESSVAEGDNITITEGLHNTTQNPCLRLDNTDTSDDLYLAQYSRYLDVNGDTDIGAYSSNARGTSFTVDDDGAVDYSSIHAQDFTCLGPSLRSGDMVTVNPGVYNGLTLPSSLSGITFTGAGVSTIFNGTSTSNPLSLSSVDNSTFSNFVVQNASTTGYSYTLTKLIYQLGATVYDTAGSNSSFVLYGNNCETDLLEYTGGTVDITSYINTSHWNLALGESDSVKLTILARDDVYPDGASIIAACGLTIDEFVSDVFTYNSGDATFTYNVAAVAGVSGLNVAEGYSDPPTLMKNILDYRHGIKLANSSGNTFSSVTSTGNTYGIYFTGTSANNNFNDGVIQNSTSYDVYSDSAGTNNIKNTSFSFTSSTISGGGQVSVYEKMRVRVLSDGSGVSGVTVHVSSNNGSVTSTLTSAAGGYTSYTDYILSFILNDDSPLTTQGGYNPFSVTALQFGEYNQSVTSATIDTANETVEISMTEGAQLPNAVTNFAISMSTSTANLSWTDNSSGNLQEDYVQIDYITGSDTSNFPGTSVTTTADTTSTVISSLVPNTEYVFRIKAVNDLGDSAYVTSSPYYTDPVSPAISVAQNGPKSIRVTLTSGNGAGTIYEIYNDTDSDVVTSSTTSTAYSVSGLVANTLYTFKARAQYLSSSTQWTAYSTTSSASTAQVSSQATVSMSVGEVVAFELTTAGSHTVTLDSITDSSAVITIASNNPTQVSLGSVGASGSANSITATLSSVSGQLVTLVLADQTNGSQTPAGGRSSEPVVPFGGIVISGVTKAVTNIPQISVTLLGLAQEATDVMLSAASSFLDAVWQPLNGLATVSFTLPEVEGVHTIYAKVRDTAGTMSVIRSAQVTYDKSAPLNPPIILLPQENTLITKLPFSISGNAQPGASVHVEIGGTTYTVDVPDTGLFSVTILEQLTEGDYKIFVHQSDALHHVSGKVVRNITYTKPRPIVVMPIGNHQGNQTSSTTASSDLGSAGDTIVGPYSGENSTTIEDMKNKMHDVERSDAFMLILQEYTPLFNTQQVEGVVALYSEELNVVVRPDTKVHSITARLYPEDRTGEQFLSDEESPLSVWKKIQQWFIEPTYAAYRVEPGWIKGYVFESLNQVRAYQGHIDLNGFTEGRYTLVVSLNGEDGSRTHISKAVTILHRGTLYDSATKQSIQSAVVKLFEKQGEGWKPWGAEDYGQENPLFVQSDGEYAFAVSPGTYRVEIESNGYAPYTSSAISFSEPGVIIDDIYLDPIPKNAWIRFWDWVKYLWS